MTAINLIATIKAHQQSASEVHALLVAYGAHVLTMDGSERFEVYVDRDEPTVLIVIERYRDEAAFEEHLADPANAELNAKMAPLTDGGSTLRFLST